MGKYVHTNIKTFREIINESYKSMTSDLRKSILPKPDGGSGFIKKLDPEKKSFKHGFVIIIFTGLWIDAFLHQSMVKYIGMEKAKKFDSEIYENKLIILSINNDELIKRVKDFRLVRNKITHEKAYFDEDDYKTAQGEAEKAYHLLVDIEKEIKERHEKI